LKDFIPSDFLSLKIIQSTLWMPYQILQIKIKILKFINQYCSHQFSKLDPKALKFNLTQMKQNIIGLKQDNFIKKILEMQKIC